MSAFLANETCGGLSERTFQVNSMFLLFGDNGRNRLDMSGKKPRETVKFCESPGSKYSGKLYNFANASPVKTAENCKMSGR